MSWIRRGDPKTDPELAVALERARAGYPIEYSQEKVGEMRVPDAVKADSIVMSHSLIPRALEHFFAGYAALLDPALPLSRRQHELIAATVSSVNRCFF